MSDLEFKLKALTPIWTGGVDIGECVSFRTSGIIGSLRWWYELAVRALGGYACCPFEKPCPDKDGKYCAVCELFGCTDWSRKFKLRVESTNGAVVKGPLQEDTVYLFRLIFTKDSDPKEKWLLMNLIKDVIAPYGSIGGKMPNKPSEHAFNKSKPALAAKQKKIYHQDFGLFKVVSDAINGKDSFTKDQIKDYIDNFKVKGEDGSCRINNQDWPTLNHLFAIKGSFQSACFDRVKINKLLGIKPHNPSATGFCLQGLIGEKSKDIFSFKKDRVWGYCKDDAQRTAIVAEIKSVLGSLVTEEVVGDDFLSKIFSYGGGNV